MGEDRVLRAAAEALRTEGVFKVIEAPDGIPSICEREPEELARIVWGAALDSLLEELPEQAVEAARRKIDGGGQSYYIAWGYPDEDDVRGKLDADAMARNSVEAFLRSLRQGAG